jgi:anti-sigma regulatory factor (Ser/Thr protein kinase)
MGLSLKLEVPSDPQLLSVVRSAVQQIAAVMGFADRDCRLITLAVDEALANIIRHAYGNRHDRPVEVHCRCRGSRLEFVLVDRGKSVKPEKLRGRELDDVRPGGLGVHLIAQIMDSVTYKPLRGRNELRLVKRLPNSRDPESGAKT